MKTLFAAFVALIAAVTLATAANFSVQTYTITNGISTAYLTNTVAATSTNSSLAVVVPCTDFNTVGISLTTKLAGSGSTAINYLFVGTMDGTVYSSDTKRTVTVTPNGTTAVNTVTNLDCTGFQALKLIEIDNPNASALTNQAFSVGYKRAKDLNPGF